MSTSPIVPGFHPDPSICRVGEEYFLVNSSFEYLPGVPIRRSRDLVAWELIGNVLDRPSQMEKASTGHGIFAPTLRHHDGRFWMITTDFDRIRDGQLIVWADDPAGPWSDPVFTTGATGIDPDLVWDGDDCYLTWANFFAEYPIQQAKIDPYSGRLLSEPRPLWHGTGLAATEGPHLFQHDGWWYLLTAEGGTERGHVVSIARSRAVSGPFEANPAGPVLTHRSTTHPVQNTGHADLVELVDGSWAMVYLGVRARGVTPRFHVNGRETFLAHVEFVDGWPVVDEDRYQVEALSHSLEESFDGPELGPEWIVAGRWLADFGRLEDGLHLDAASEDGPSMVGIRALDETWAFEVELAEGDASLIIRLDDDHAARVRRRADTVVAEVTIGSVRSTLGASVPSPDGRAVLRARSTSGEKVLTSSRGPDTLTFSVEIDGVETDLGSIDGRYFSTEVAGGFTGRVLGVEAGATSSRVRRIAYKGGPVEG